VRVTVQLLAGESVAPQVVEDRKGHSLVMRRTVSGVDPELVRVRERVEVCPEGTWPNWIRRPGRRSPVMVSVPWPLPKPFT